MAMEPDVEKVACGMAKADLFEGKSLFRGGNRRRRSFAVTADGRLADRRSALSIRPAKWFGIDQATQLFPPARLSRCA
jgi:hypothetical protein